MVQACRSNCRCFLCKVNHQTLLHNTSLSRAVISTNEKSSTNSLESSNTDLSKSSAVHVTKISRSPFNKVLFATARIYVESPSGLKVLARALVDQCSQVCIVSRSLCQRLRLKANSINTPISGIGSSTAAVSSEFVSFTIHPRFQSIFSCEVQALVLPRISSYTPPSICTSYEISHLEGLDLADPNFMDQGHIDILLGASIHARIIEGKIIRGKENDILAIDIASLSLIGWLLSGDLPGKEPPHVTRPITFHCAGTPPPPPPPPLLMRLCKSSGFSKSYQLKPCTRLMSRSVRITLWRHTPETQTDVI